MNSVLTTNPIARINWCESLKTPSRDNTTFNGYYGAWYLSEDLNKTLSEACDALGKIFFSTNLKRESHVDRAHIYGQHLNFPLTASNPNWHNGRAQKPQTEVNDVTVELFENHYADFNLLAESVEVVDLELAVDSNRSTRYCNAGGGMFIKAMLKIEGTNVPVIMGIGVAKQLFPEFKCDFTENTLTIQGKSFKVLSLKSLFTRVNDQYNNSKFFEWNLYGLSFLNKRIPMGYEELDQLLKLALQDKSIMEMIEPFPAKLGGGVTKLAKRLESLASELKEKYPVEYCYYNSILGDTARNVEGVKGSVIFNKVFEDVTDIKAMRKACLPNRKCLSFPTKDYWSTERRNHGADSWYTSNPDWKQFRKESIAKQSSRAFKKKVEDVTELDVSQELFPKLYKAVNSGEIPVSAFFRKKEQYFLLNDNFVLWEEMLKRDRATTIQLAQEVAKRANYQKDLMSYFFFVLHELPEYLKKQTGKSWKCYPKLVHSEKELEPPKAGDDSGIARTRSALTPIVDNEAKTVVVPYASLRISGAFTQYCYSHDYHVLRRGFSFNGNTVVSELETKLNGRDDYGLMFYTLTGSPTATGYPTFLIIFERRSSGTHVHFHRVHPHRSKDGDEQPIHSWIRTCYGWMIGNVPRTSIVAQQGDLAFVKLDECNKDFTDQVEYFDNHEFGDPVWFIPNTAKDNNILGLMKLDNDTWLNHHEHENVLIPSGEYTLYQLKTWEANPKGIWSLRID